MFLRIKDIKRVDSKFKDISWHSRTSGNLIGDRQDNTQKKNLRNNGESGCG